MAVMGDTKFELVALRFLYEWNKKNRRQYYDFYRSIFIVPGNALKYCFYFSLQMNQMQMYYICSDNRMGISKQQRSVIIVV